MFYISLARYQALVSYLASPLPVFHCSYDHQHRWLYLKLLTFEMSVYRTQLQDNWRTVH